MLERTTSPTSADDCVARARALAPLITAHAARIEERREIVPIFRNISDFAQWAVANELWKRRLAKDGELTERLSQIRFFKTVSFLREAGLVPQAFRPKRWRPKYVTPVALDKATPNEP